MKCLRFRIDGEVPLPDDAFAASARIGLINDLVAQLTATCRQDGGNVERTSRIVQTRNGPAPPSEPGPLLRAMGEGEPPQEPFRDPNAEGGPDVSDWGRDNPHPPEMPRMPEGAPIGAARLAVVGGSDPTATAGRRRRSRKDKP